MKAESVTKVSVFFNISIINVYYCFSNMEFRRVSFIMKAEFLVIIFNSQ